MNRSDIHLMIDIETMGTFTTAAIISIGAAKFSIDGGILDKFYINLDLSTSKEFYRTTDQDTINWWKAQSKDAILAWMKDPKPYASGLFEFHKWLGNCKDTNVWARGIDFDLPIIKSSLESVNLSIPWKFWNQYDQRTITNLAGIPSNQMLREGESHNALDDCITQIKYLIPILDSIVE